MNSFKCDHPECGNIFRTNNPESCPKCNSVDFSNINIKSNKGFVKYGILILLIGAGLFFLKNDNNPNTESNIVKVEGNNENVEDSKLNIDVEPKIIEENNSDIFTEKVETPTTKKTVKTKKEIPLKEEILTETEYWERGNKYYDEEKYLLAIKDFTQAINLSDYIYYDYYYQRGLSYFFADQEQNAINDFNQAIKLNQTADAYYYRADANSNLGNYNKAIEGFTECIKKDAYYDWAYYSRGKTKYLKGEYRSAINDLNIFIKVIPDFSWAYYYRGLSYSFLGDKNDRTQDGYYRDALDDYNSSLIHNPNSNNDLFLYRGEAYYVLEKYNKALVDFNYYINNVDGGNQDDYAFYLRSLVKEELSMDACTDIIKCCELGDSECCDYLIDIDCN